MSGLMLNSPGEVIRQLLVDLGAGTLPSVNSTEGVWPLFVAKEPPTPDSCVTIQDTESILQGRHHLGGSMAEFFGFQVRIRAPKFSPGYSKSNAILLLMDTVAYRNLVTIGSSIYLVQAITRRGGVLSLGDESPQSTRQLFTINATASITQTA